ncbi:DUF3450 domain-containing protein [Algiphilus sp.]|uniref:DUF3450 domain-containing protein n=1 Tax=Algiphilus sp. TaxID=1872431 RepID=UPI003B529682
MYRSTALASWLLLGLLAVLPGAQAQSDTVEQSLDTQEAAERAAAASQRRIDALDDETRALLQRYRETLREAETLERYNRRIEKLVASQEEEISSKRDQLTRIDETNRQIYPHLEDLLETLERFVALDVPFLPRERRQRLQSLQAMMDRADVTVSEKYRRLLEAYQIELEYGRTIGSYEGTLGEGEEGRSVTFLRVGRVALLYQTRDGKEAGYWDRQRAAFVEDDDYRDAVRRGLRVAEKRAAPELLRAPVYAPEVTP